MDSFIEDLILDLLKQNGEMTPSEIIDALCTSPSVDEVSSMIQHLVFTKKVDFGWDRGLSLKDSNE